jgi:hypothetical protein
LFEKIDDCFAVSFLGFDVKDANARVLDTAEELVVDLIERPTLRETRDMTRLSRRVTSHRIAVASHRTGWCQRPWMRRHDKGFTVGIESMRPAAGGWDGWRPVIYKYNF